MTDGPFLYRGKKKLWMLWSSLSGNGYAAGLSFSVSGMIGGPWVHMDKPLYQGDGGHGMFFKDISGALKLALHAPNRTPFEQPHFISAEDRGDEIVLLHEEEEG